MHLSKALATLTLCIGNTGAFVIPLTHTPASKNFSKLPFIGKNMQKMPSNHIYMSPPDSSAPDTTTKTPSEETTSKETEKKTQTEPATTPSIDISKLDIRVGVIQKVWEHEEADKLYCEEIDIGEESGPRQIASGLKAHYDIAAMEGRRVLVLANLKTRKLVGFPSHGMVLCAVDDSDKVVFVEPPEGAEVGERVTVEGYDGEPATENQVIKKKMLNAIFPELKTDESGTATYMGKPLSTSAGPCVAEGEMTNAQIS